MAVATAEEEQVKIAAILRKQEEPGGTWFRELLKHLVGRNPPTQIATSDEESARSGCEKRLRRVGRANRTIDYDIVRGGAFPIKPLDPSRKEQLVEPAHPPGLATFSLPLITAFRFHKGCRNSADHCRMTRSDRVSLADEDEIGVTGP